jgi:uncharacterized protein YndB with AHSA1/START domain
MPKKSGEAAINDQTVREKTGKVWSEWFAILDEFGAKEKGHKETARHLEKALHLSPWWSQMVTVRFEQERGLRLPGQRSGGTFTISLQRTIQTTAEKAFQALTEPTVLSQWFTHLAQAELSMGVRYSNADGDRGKYLILDRPRRIRFTWDNPDHCPGTLVEITITTRPDSRVVVHLDHTEIGTKAGYEDMKKGWAWALDCLKSFLETGKPIPHL